MNVSKGEQTTNKKNDNTVINIDIDSGDEDENSPHSNCLLQHAKLPSYLAHAFQDLYQEDGLLVCGRGMGLLHLIASFCRFYVDVDEGHVALLQEELEYEKEKLSNDRPSHNRQQQYQELPTKRKQNQIMQNQMMQINSIQKQLHIKKPLVFVIGLRNYERSCLISILERWGTPTDLLPTEITNESGQGKDRGVLYARGGIFLITSRILIVDLLTHVASPKDIDGILVAHAENISEQSTEAFILRIYRTQKRFGVENTSINVNQSHSRDGGTGSGSDSQSSIIQSFRYGFIKAFSDAPDTLMSGFAKVDKILKALFVRRLYIYPRFHDIVVEELERTPPIVEELHQSLSPKMMEIQASIAAAVKTCIREIKKSVTLIDWTDADLTLENCVTTNFDLKISHQLESDWHRLKPATKQLVNDLRQLRTLFHYLLQYDCISFWRLINNIKTMGASSRNPSLWLLTPAADRLFKAAKERIYTIENGNEPTKDNPKPVKRLIPVLEENPKWRLLHQVLSEIEGRYKKLNTHKGDRVLVMVKDERTLDSIRSYLVDGKEKTMKKRWLGYLKHVNDRARALAKSSGGASYVPEQTRLLLEEEGKIRNYLFGPGQKNTHVKPQGTGDNSSNKSKRKAASLNAMPSWKKKRRKIQEERCRGNAMMDSIEDREQVAMLDEALQETEHYDVEIISKTTNLYNGYDNPYKTNNSSNNTALHHDDDDNNDDNDDNDDDDDEFMLYRAEEINDLRVVIQTYSSAEGEQAYLLLNDIKPNYIVLYDAEPSFIRSIEIHSAAVCQDDDKGNNNKNGETTTEDRLRVYFMLFEASSEEKNYLRALEREQNAFERLIQHKKTMALPVNMLGPWTTQEMQLAGGNGVGGSYNSGSLPLSMDTRTGRGKKVNAEKRDVAVDVREFRSALPCILHQGGMRLAPVTLTVGDFVLSNVHCIERKSISDLFGSFASGRLFSQAETMSKHYKVPCLLIEFNPSKTFCLQNANEIGPDLRSDSVCSKMSLLMMHFPKLRLLWSRSPYETLKLFKRLKSNHEEVDVAKAVAIGSNESIDALLMGGAGNNNDNNANTDDGSAKDDVQQVAVDINEAGKDMLLRLPGITMHNARKVMSACDTIAELASFPREEMKRLLGPLAGQKLFTFFNQNMEFK